LKRKNARKKNWQSCQAMKLKRSSIDLSCKKEEPEVDSAKQLKSVEPSCYNPVSETGEIHTKTMPQKIYQLHQKFELK